MATPLTRDQARTLALELMETHGLIAAGWTLRINRAKAYSGIADFELKEIGISGPMIDVCAPSAVRETILHEIAHALVGEAEPDEHGPLWVAKAREIGSSAEVEEMSYLPRVYTSKCPHCGAQGDEIALLRWRKSCASDSCFEQPAGSRLVSWVEVPPKAIPLPGKRRSLLAVQELEARLAAIGPVSS